VSADDERRDDTPRTGSEAPREASGGAPAIRADGLTRRFGPLTAVDGLSLEVEPGEVFGLIGANGAGKSVTIKMLTTLLPPTSGRAWVAGFEVTREAAAVRRHIGYVPQMVSADGALTGSENLLVSARLYGVPRRERATRIAEALALMDLGEAAPKLVRHYSGGMIRRLEIAQSLLHRPTVLFMDEPTVGLDPVAREAVWRHVRDVRARFGTTLFVTTHYMEEAEEQCDRVAILARGRLVALGAPSALKAEAGPEATMDDVFVRFTGGPAEVGEAYRDVVRARRTARRLG
jgi:ABC-2 type transport system ATP-binding protein